MGISLYEHQLLAMNQLKNGSILCGSVGSGKSRTALAYFYVKECNGQMQINGEGKYKRMESPKDLYIITTARKRDTFEWEQELAPFLLPDKKSDKKVFIDSWNNIGKYVDVENAFFIFDEQRVVGYGAWAKAFLKIAKKNRWILLTATPGDTWMDYIPVFIANGFYKNKTDFVRRHVIYNRSVKFPKVDRYVEVGRLIKLRKMIMVNMKFVKPTVKHKETITVDYDKKSYNTILKDRWNIFKNEPVKDISEMCFAMRRVSNTSEQRKQAVRELINEHPRSIIFYNFNYELDILREIGKELDVQVAEWNGFVHQPLPESGNWIYLVQYAAGAEGWNCITTNTIIFFSQNYSYKAMVQASGRIDRMNTPYSDLYYYTIRSNSSIDIAIAAALNKKKSFNESIFVRG